MAGLTEMLKGVLEGVVLEICSREEVYGYEIVRRLGRLGFENVAEGTVYALLVRLERNGHLDVSRRPSRQGPPRKFYTLSRRGRAELASFWQRWDFLAGRIEALRSHMERESGDDGGDVDDRR